MTFCCNNVYEVLCKSKDLSTLKSLVDLAGLQCNLKNLKCSTLFAPTNAALAATDPALVAYLTAPANRQLLRNVLLYHITNKPYTTGELQPSLVLTMANGKRVVVYRALYYDWVPVLQDETQDRWDVIEGNIATKCNNYVQKINGLMRPEVIYYPKVLNPRNEPGTF